MKRNIILILSILFFCNHLPGQQPRTHYVNPFLGTATLWDANDLGYTPTRRTWGAEVFPGASLPNAMVQVSPVTLFGSGSGYQYEDSVIYAFTHTNKGHWNLCHVPLLPVTGKVSPDNYQSPYTHRNESAHPGYYQVFLERYGINVELTSTLRCAYHKYTYKKGDHIQLLADLSKSNERVRDWHIEKTGKNVFTGFQETGEKIYFYAVSNYGISTVQSLGKDKNIVSLVDFVQDNAARPLELKIGFSFVSIENAKENLSKEIAGKSFAQIQTEAQETWEALLSKIDVSGGSEEQYETFYSSLYRSFLWPALRSDGNGEYVDVNGKVANNGFRYYTNPSFWDDYRNKLILLGILSPDVAADVINSITDKGEKKGFMPTFFHGDHASVFVAGTYLRGIRGFDIERAYRLILKNATIEGAEGRPYLNEYIRKGYISEMDIPHPKLETVAKAAVTKTQEYAYDDYAVALVAKALKDEKNHASLMERSKNYKNLFDPATGHMRPRLESGEWIKNFDPQVPYYEYMYREANGWQSTFFAPHDPQGLIGLYPDKKAFEDKLDSLFSIPWRGYEAHNLSVFIGQYCHGNQPDHNFPYLYYFVGKQEKSQAILDHIMNHFYRMGKEGLSLAGMDDAGEMSSWYVLNAIGLYTFSPADPEYIVSVPLFKKTTLWLGDDDNCTITKQNSGTKITSIISGGKKIDGYFITHNELKNNKDLIILTE
ncbi:MAG TPA: glycoside hydrolase family 92 protein [Porphyromonadaceae bacterium]|mgnify:CR=1 FL=1|jgi:predicted alpha-1,2-mannosidase|nr:glycoside hydrolase family 92 protein [Porphyromonadaceae bacterium]